MGEDVCKVFTNSAARTDTRALFLTPVVSTLECTGWIRTQMAGTPPWSVGLQRG